MKTLFAFTNTKPTPLKLWESLPDEFPTYTGLLNAKQLKLAIWHYFFINTDFKLSKENINKVLAGELSMVAIGVRENNYSYTIPSEPEDYYNPYDIPYDIFILNLKHGIDLEAVADKELSAPYKKYISACKGQDKVISNVFLAANKNNDTRIFSFFKIDMALDEPTPVDSKQAIADYLVLKLRDTIAKSKYRYIKNDIVITIPGFVHVKYIAEESTTPTGAKIDPTIKLTWDELEKGHHVQCLEDAPDGYGFRESSYEINSINGARQDVGIIDDVDQEIYWNEEDFFKYFEIKQARDKDKWELEGFTRKPLIDKASTYPPGITADTKVEVIYKDMIDVATAVSDSARDWGWTDLDLTHYRILEEEEH